MIATSDRCLLDQWRHRFGGRRCPRQKPRTLAALGYLAHGPVVEGLVEVDHLTLVVLYDEPTGCGQTALRLAGYAGSRVAWGVRWGGAGQCRFFKDLLLQPVPQARGLRLDVHSADLLRLGLQLDRQIDRHVRHRPLPVRQPIHLPKLWAGFRGADVAAITGDGPELAAYAQRIGRPPQQVLQHLRRDYFGLVLYPLAWVSHHWEQALAVFADLERFPRRQVFPLDDVPHDLIGFQEASDFDFFSSRFRQQRRNKNRCPVLAAG